ncbi:MAG: aspartate/glutamate racemase family protein [Burkholderiales bacterium]|nr:aspartate/glutamate racemase family protein [Burkholderiales bacterium]
MMNRVLLGMLTPSSNTVLEPVSSAMVAGLPEVSVHFGRFRVTEISLSQQALAQFNDAEFLGAARLLADAQVQVIGWNGTSAGWKGFDADARLCATITEATGIAACTSVLALNELLALAGVRRLALVTPYIDDVQAKIIANYRSIGIECVAEQHLGISHNFSFSEVSAEQLRQMMRAVAAANPQAIAVFCTNLRGGPLAAQMEAELGIPVFDSVATVIWKSLKLVGVDTGRVRGWGRLFEL